MPELPKYKQIAADLRARIDSGEFPEGEALPPESKLMEQYDMARGTVRQALGVLRDEGVTEARHGSGVYVRTFRPIVRNALKRLSADQWGQGESIWKVDVEDRPMQATGVQIERAPASEDVARFLDLEVGDPVWSRSRRYFVEEVPVMLSTSYIPDDLATNTAITQVDSGPGGVYARLGGLGHAPTRFREELRCRMPSQGEADALELSAATPVVEMRRYAYDESDRIVEVNRMILDSSRYLLVYDFPA